MTFVELFFDLVFVFGVTELTGLLRRSHDAGSAVRVVIVFWLLWWGWTQFTWALNAANTFHPVVVFGTLASVFLAFGMATGVGTAFERSGWWFALPYVGLRVIGLAIYLWVSAEDEKQRRAVVGFTTISVSGMVAVLVGAPLSTGGRTAVWGAAVALDLVAAARVGRRGSYGLDPHHFIERHALFVILALGESLLAVGAPIPGAARTGGLITAAIAGVAIVCLLWWTYFAHIKPQLDDAMHASDVDDISTLARDVYSLLHFPVLCGIVAIAAAAEEAVAHPSEPLAWFASGELAVGLLLYIGGLSVVHRRASSVWLWHRVLISIAGAGLVLAIRSAGSTASMAVAVATLLAVAAYEEVAFDARACAARPQTRTAPPHDQAAWACISQTRTSASSTAVSF